MEGILTTVKLLNVACTRHGHSVGLAKESNSTCPLHCSLFDVISVSSFPNDFNIFTLYVDVNMFLSVRFSE